MALRLACRPSWELAGAAFVPAGLSPGFASSLVPRAAGALGSVRLRAFRALRLIVSAQLALASFAAGLRLPWCRPACPDYRVTGSGPFSARVPRRAGGLSPQLTALSPSLRSAGGGRALPAGGLRFAGAIFGIASSRSRAPAGGRTLPLRLTGSASFSPQLAASRLRLAAARLRSLS